MSRLVVAFLVIFAVAIFAGVRPTDKPEAVSAAVNTYTFTVVNGGLQTFQVPTGVTQVTIEAVGALGGSGGTIACGLAPGGAGGRVVVSNVTVTPGEVLNIFVGGQGLPGQSGGFGGFNGGGFGGLGIGQTGGGGGGSSDVRQGGNALANRIVVAGGGGGGGACAATGLQDDGGPGGSANAPTGNVGGNAISGLPGSGLGGGGGTQAAGGAAGGGTNSLPSTPGALLTGGNGGVNTQPSPGGPGGGGGGGVFGGGGGGAGIGDVSNGGGGGGGGGSNRAGAGTVVANGINGTVDPAARVIISFTDTPSGTKTFNPQNVALNANSLLTITLSNTNAFALTPINFTDPFPAGMTITGTPLNSCGGTLTAGLGGISIILANGTIPANSSCSISVLVASSIAGARLNTVPAIPIVGAAAIPAFSGTLNVAAAAVIPPTSTPTATPTLVPVFIPPVIPQVFQHVPQGIFNGTRNNTPTPVRPALAPVVIDPGGIIVITPPRTGDAGLAKALRLPAAW